AAWRERDFLHGLRRAVDVHAFGRPTPNPALRMLARDGTRPRMTNHVAALEVVRRRVFARAVRLLFAAEVFTSADDGLRLAEHEILAERVLAVARVEARQREAPRIHLRWRRRRKPTAARWTRAQVELDRKLDDHGRAALRGTEPDASHALHEAVDHRER